MTRARKATKDRAGEKATEVRDQVLFSNELPKYIEEPQSVKRVVETHCFIEEFNTQVDINTITPKKVCTKKG